MKELIFDELKNTLSEMLDSMEPVPYPPTEIVEYESVVFDCTEKDNAKWKELISAYIATAKTFEIHCWTEETEEISLALQYGTEKPTNWKYGRVIKGDVTPAFKEMLLQLPKPSESTNGYNMMTPFFGIVLDNGFTSAHYGTENQISSKQPDKLI